MFICHTEKSAKHPYMGNRAINANIETEKKSHISRKKEDLYFSLLYISLKTKEAEKTSFFSPFIISKIFVHKLIKQIGNLVVFRLVLVLILALES